MAEQHDEKTRTVELEHLEAFRFRVTFGGGIADLVADEPVPLGGGSGPDAARMLAAAVGNCLSASLYLCLQKSRLAVSAMKTSVTLTIGRNEAGRFRVVRGHVSMALDAEGERARLERCLGMFEDYCIVTATVRNAFPITVVVTDAAGAELYRSAGQAVTAPV